MKILSFCLAVAVSLSALSQQDSTLSERLGNAIAYRFHSINGPADFVSRLHSAYDFLLKNDPAGRRLIGGIEYDLDISPDSAAGIFIDSSLAAFKRQHLWEENLDLKPVIQVPMTTYISRVCPCMAERIIKTGGLIEITNAAACHALIMRDTALAQQMINAGKGLPGKDQLRLSSVFNQAMLEECPPFYALVAHSVKLHMVDEYLFSMKNDLIRFTKSIMDLRKQRSSELARIFPAYERYASDIDAMIKAKKDDFVYLYDHLQREKKGVTYRSAYAYRYVAGEMKLLGELIYSVNRYPAWQMLSYHFTPAGKMKNKAQAERELKEKAPVPLFTDEPAATPAPQKMKKEN